MGSKTDAVWIRWVADGEVYWSDGRMKWMLLVGSADSPVAAMDVTAEVQDLIARKLLKSPKKLRQGARPEVTSAGMTVLSAA